MSVSYSSLLKLNNILTGTEEGTWGDITNTNICTLVEQAIAGAAAIDVSGGNVTLTNTDGASSQARCMILAVYGSPGVTRNIQAPNTSKVYVVANGSDSSVVIKTSTSTGLTVPSGEVYMVYYDTTATDFIYVGQSATSANTPNKLVLRDASGNFSANEITAASFSGALAAGTTANTVTPATDNTTKVATTAFVQSAITAATSLLGSMSTQNANNVNVTGGTIANTTNGGATTSAANALGYLGIPQNGKSGAYTLALTDAGGHVYYTGAAATISVPTNASVAIPVGSAITLINNGSASITIGTTGITMYFAGTSNTGNRTLATKGMATMIKVATDTWFISGAGLS